jgi:4a-hydroxytetrahydrobiopterin dehydratase
MADVLNPDAFNHELDRLTGWGGTTDKISKEYSFSSFPDAIAFVDRVAELAEQADHHPDIHIFHRRVRLDYVTHSAGGVTQSDLREAGRVDRETTDLQAS